MEKSKQNTIIVPAATIDAKQVFIKNGAKSLLNLKAPPPTPQQPAFSIFNKQYNVISSLGEGRTSKVYLCEEIKDPSKQIALKILKPEFLKEDENNVKTVELEIQILIAMKHKNIINILGFGSQGQVVKRSGRVIKNIVYIEMQYVKGILLFDFCKKLGAMGEDAGRFFMDQIIDTLQYMQKKGVAHRDLKLENILIDDDLNLKILDFGASTFKKVEELKSYRGTQTYMAPEIREGKVYNGNQIDIFSVGVILFVIVNGIFPFKRAHKSDYFFNLLIKGQHEKYWQKIERQGLSDEFKDLSQKLFDYQGNQRLKIEEFKLHPWMIKPFETKNIKEKLQIKYNHKDLSKTFSSSSHEQVKKKQ